jgi:hypothetical protein
MFVPFPFLHHLRGWHPLPYSIENGLPKRPSKNQYGFAPGFTLCHLLEIPNSDFTNTFLPFWLYPCVLPCLIFPIPILDQVIFTETHFSNPLCHWPCSPIFLPLQFCIDNFYTHLSPALTHIPVVREGLLWLSVKLIMTPKKACFSDWVL